jgi:hypothetical protein
MQPWSDLDEPCRDHLCASLGVAVTGVASVLLSFAMIDAAPSPDVATQDRDLQV